MATWQSTITRHGPVEDMLVDIQATRTDGAEEVTVGLQGVRAENATAALRDEVAAKLKALADKQIADDAAEVQLTNWSSQLDTALNALET